MVSEPTIEGGAAQVDGETGELVETADPIAPAEQSVLELDSAPAGRSILDDQPGQRPSAGSREGSVDGNINDHTNAGGPSQAPIAPPQATKAAPDHATVDEVTTIPVGPPVSAESIVEDAASSPTLTTTDAQGGEDSAIPLDIDASFSLGVETLSITISGVPSGAALSAGTGQW